jgi:hypothetical protein
MAILKRRAVMGALAFITALAFMGAWLINQAQQDPFHADAIEERPFPSLTYSVQTFLWWDDGYTGLILDFVNMIGFNHIKQNFAWRDLESEPGVWDFSSIDRILAETERRNIRIIARLGQVPDWAVEGNQQGISSNDTDAPPEDLEDWGNYCHIVASQYAGRIVAYQIWNEPNLSREWGNQEPDPEGYVELLRVCSEAIRAVDDEAIIISAGLAPTGNQDVTAYRDDIYLDSMYQAGFQQYVDVVGVHAPGFAPPEYGPDDAELDGQGRWATFRRVEDLRKIMIQHGDAGRQMAILEMGWTTDTQNPDYAWFAVSEEEQADYIVRAYAYAAENWRPWVGLMSLIYMPNMAWTSDNEEWWWSIIEPPTRNRPAFYSLVHMPKVCDDVMIPALPYGLTEEEYRVAINACP